MAAYRISAIFPLLEDQHLPKEVVQIPHHLGNLMNVDRELVSLERGASFSQKEKLAPRTEFRVLKPETNFLFVDKALIRFLRKNARSIDLLVLFHFKKETYFLATLYKLLNPKGSIYLKGDVYNRRLDQRTASYSRKPLYRPLLRTLEKAAFRSIDLLSVENHEALKIIEDQYPELSDRTFYLPSGVDTEWIERTVPAALPIEERPKRILIVGRIGLHVKGHDILLQALKGIDPKDFGFRFIGPEAEGFDVRKQELFRERPDLREKIVFLGPIQEREELFKEFARARFLCLPSRAESFGLVLVEAGVFGVPPIGTDAIDSFDVITDHERFGTKVPSEDPEALREALQAHIEDPDSYQKEASAYAEHIRTNFDWKDTVLRLHSELNSRIQGLPPSSEPDPV